MASSIVSGSTNAHGYPDEPPDNLKRAPKPNYYKEEEKIFYSCGNGSLFLKISSALLTVSFVLQVIAVGSPYWAAGWRQDKMSWFEGVWMTCVRKEANNNWKCGAYDYHNKAVGLPGWYMFCQAMGLLSIVIFLPALLINFFYTMHPKEKMFRGLRSFNFVLTLATALIPIVTVIVFAAGHPKDDRFPIPSYEKEYNDSPFEFHFSFAFEIIAFLVSGIAFALEIVDYRQSGY